MMTEVDKGNILNGLSAMRINDTVGNGNRVQMSTRCCP
jgi:hypothetical protein